MTIDIISRKKLCDPTEHSLWATNERGRDPEKGEYTDSTIGCRLCDYRRGRRFYDNLDIPVESIDPLPDVEHYRFRVTYRHTVTGRSASCVVICADIAEALEAGKEKLSRPTQTKETFWVMGHYDKALVTKMTDSETRNGSPSIECEPSQAQTSAHLG